MATYLEHFQHRLLQDALAEASAAFWRARADDLRAARPTAADYIPAGRLDAARTRWRELTEAARACDNRAAFLERHGAEMFAEQLCNALHSCEVFA